MYQDPKRVRTRYAALNLDQYEAQLIDALVDYTGIERASLLRQGGWRGEVDGRASRRSFSLEVCSTHTTQQIKTESVCDGLQATVLQREERSRSSSS